MGFWPFGRDPANVEMVSRVITGQTQNGYRLRGKLTIHFAEPQKQADADHAGDRCTTQAVTLIREAPDHGKLIGAELAISADLMARYPADLPRPRHVELAALHVVGDPALSDELRRASSTSGTMAAVSPPSAPAPSTRAPSNAPASVRPPSVKPPSAQPPPAAIAPPPPPPPRRRASSQIRSIQSLLMPPGTPPAAMGQFIAPLVKDSSARMLIGFLRAHDLAARGVSIDEGSAEMLASLVPVSDAPPGGYEASRAGEIARWQAALGEGPMFALHREVRIASVHLAREALARTEVMPALADGVIEALVSAAFPDEAGVLTELDRFSGDHDFVATLATNLTKGAGTTEAPSAIASALKPLVAMVQDDLGVAAMIIKASSGG